MKEVKDVMEVKDGRKRRGKSKDGWWKEGKEGSDGIEGSEGSEVKEGRKRVKCRMNGRKEGRVEGGW